MPSTPLVPGTRRQALPEARCTFPPRVPAYVGTATIQVANRGLGMERQVRGEVTDMSPPTRTALNRVSLVVFAGVAALVVGGTSHVSAHRLIGRGVPNTCDSLHSAAPGSEQ